LRSQIVQMKPALCSAPAAAFFALAQWYEATGQPACRLVSSGKQAAKCSLPQGAADNSWPVARSYHSMLAFANQTGRGSEFQKQPEGNIVHSTVSLLSVDEVKDFPVRNFFLRTPASAMSWANTPEGEWTTTVDSTAGGLVSVLRLGAGGICSLASLSVYRPAADRLTLRLNFDACDAASDLLHAAVAVDVQRTEADSGLGLATWMCAFMPDQKVCTHLGGGNPGHAAVLKFNKELGWRGRPAIWKRLTSVMSGCFESFVWITLDNASRSDGSTAAGGAALSLNKVEWDLITSYLPIVTIPPADADVVLTTDHVCLVVGGHGGSCVPETTPNAAGGPVGPRSWWKLFVAAFIAAVIGIALALATLLCGSYSWRCCPTEDSNLCEQDGTYEPVLSQSPTSRQSEEFDWVEHKSTTHEEVLNFQDGDNPFEVEVQIDETVESACPLKPSILDNSLTSLPQEELQQDSSSEHDSECHTRISEPTPCRSSGFGGTDPEEHLMAAVVGSLQNGPREVSELVDSLSQLHNVVVEGDFKPWLVVRGFTVIGFDGQRAMVSLPFGGVQLRV